jgi:hypothetical protein
MDFKRITEKEIEEVEKIVEKYWETFENVILVAKEYDSYYENRKLTYDNIKYIIIEFIINTDTEDINKLNALIDEFSKEQNDYFYSIIYEKFAEKYPDLVE